MYPTKHPVRVDEATVRREREGGVGRFAPLNEAATDVLQDILKLTPKTPELRVSMLTLVLSFRQRFFEEPKEEVHLDDMWDLANRAWALLCPVGQESHTPADLTLDRLRPALESWAARFVTRPKYIQGPHVPPSPPPRGFWKKVGDAFKAFGESWNRP